MFKHILIPTDGSRHSVAATQFAVDFARSINCRITALTVIEPEAAALPAGRERWLSSKQADVALKHVTSVARAAGVPAATVILRHADPSAAILHAASTLNCDLVIMATRGITDERRGADGKPVGSQAMRVVAGSPVPVLVFRLPPEAPASPS